MKTLTFRDFMNGNYDDDDYSIYIVRDNSNVLYIGISRGNVYNRWFSTDYCHISRFSNGAIRGNSIIGQAIANNLPISLDWSIDLWRVEDCIQLLGDNSPCKSEYDNDALNKLERHLIKELNPIFNVTHNTQRDTGRYITQDITNAPCDALSLRLSNA